MYVNKKKFLPVITIRLIKINNNNNNNILYCFL